MACGEKTNREPACSSSGHFLELLILRWHDPLYTHPPCDTLSFAMLGNCWSREGRGAWRHSQSAGDSSVWRRARRGGTANFWILRAFQRRCIFAEDSFVLFLNLKEDSRTSVHLNRWTRHSGPPRLAHHLFHPARKTSEDGLIPRNVLI